LYWSRVGRAVKASQPQEASIRSQSSLYWSRVGSEMSNEELMKLLLVAILIVLEQGWKCSISGTGEELT